jgi:hypothetical protein
MAWSKEEREEKIILIRKAIERGFFYKTHFLRYTGICNWRSVENVAEEEGFELPDFVEKRIERDVSSIEDALDEGAGGIIEIRELTGISPVNLYWYEENGYVEKLPREILRGRIKPFSTGVVAENKVLIYKLAMRGVSHVDIAREIKKSKKEKISARRVGQYIQDAAYYETWRMRRFGYRRKLVDAVSQNFRSKQEFLDYLEWSDGWTRKVAKKYNVKLPDFRRKRWTS